jgi:hypothetical protein
MCLHVLAHTAARIVYRWHDVSAVPTGGDGIEFSEFLRALKDIELPEDDDEHGDDSVPKPKM